MDATKQYRKEKDARKGYGSINSKALESKSIWLGCGDHCVCRDCQLFAKLFEPVSLI